MAKELKWHILSIIMNGYLEIIGIIISYKLVTDIFYAPIKINVTAFYY